ncbi:MAG: type II CRISPR RNA-guided endonuclease Cas9, partial [Cyclobacteriaceae bacterium]
MSTKKILGLDLGTNSIGWALINQDFENKTGSIIGMGSRIVPMDGAEMSNFKRGLPQTRNAVKREKKGIRVGNKRYKLRRNKLLYVLQKLNMLPEQIRLSQQFDDPLKLQKINILPIKKEAKQLTGKEFMEMRAKALNEVVTPHEFGKILYKLNQLRGYAGGDDDDAQEELDDILDIKSDKTFPTQESKIQVFKVLDYRLSDEPNKKGKKVFELEAIDAENEQWNGTTTVENLSIGDTIELNRRTWFNKKTGEPSSTEFSIPSKTGWRKKMENMESALMAHSEEKGRKTYLSEYFLDCLENDNWLKIRDNVILRSRYMEEFDAIWERQFQAHIKNVSTETVAEIASFLFPGSSYTQKQFREEAIQNGLKHIIRNQIIYYQRPLKDQSHLISECRFEKGEKAVANSHPSFQEYKLWEQINKLSINRRTKVGIKKDGKPRYKYQERNIPTDFKEYLFEELQQKKELTFSSVFNNLKNKTDFVDGEDFFNGMSVKSKLIGNTTRITLKSRLGKYWILLKADQIENQIQIWELLYNGKGNEYDINSKRNVAIARYLKEKGVNEEKFDQIVKAISKIKFPRNYQSLSLQAVEKVLPLIRAGKYFNNTAFSPEVHDRVVKLLNEHTEDPYQKSVQDYLEANESQVLTEGGFINAHALMLIYGRHTAQEISDKELLDNYQEVKALKRHSLRNPLVEQMINETLMVVKDIWKMYGRPEEIKVELARELKNSIKEREKIHERNEASQKENKKAKEILIEHKVELSSGNIEKYKLWKEQKEIDPYTGETIQFSHLFNKGLYDVDHIIPQSRYFDDSLANKVVCAKTVNKDKGNRTAMEYFDMGSTKCTLLDKDVFMDNAVKKFFGKKRKHMLATEIPDNPVERQKKETQYIAVRVREELAKIVGSNNVKTSSGGVTHYLRNHWGITSVFKDLLKERFQNYFSLKASSDFEKLNPSDPEGLKQYFEELTKSILPQKNIKEILTRVSSLETPISQEDFIELYTDSNIYKKDNNQIINGYTKRIDHRHHAMDALTVACTDQKAIKRLNDLNKHLKDWLKENINQFDLDLHADDENLLENFLQMEDSIRSKVIKGLDKFRSVERPWDGFEKDAKRALEQIIVSHKPKDKLLIQPKEEKDKNGNWIKTS